MTRGGLVTGRQSRICGSCGARLASDNPRGICSPCTRQAASDGAAAPAMPNEFWDHPTLQSAFERRRFGHVLKAYRQTRGPDVTQAVVGRWLGITQVQVSRIERGRSAVNDLDRLDRWARALRIPQRHLWFQLAADGYPDTTHASAPTAVTTAVVNERKEDQEDPVHRRQFLALSLASTAAIGVGGTARPSAPDMTDIPLDIELVRSATASYRRLDSTTESDRLRDPVTSHLTLATGLIDAFPAHSPERAAAHAVSSEIAGFAGWLAADVDDIRSARGHYQTAVRHAHAAGDRLLATYMLGSLGQFAVEADEPYQGLDVIRSARNLIAETPPPTASAWLDSLEAVALASTGHPHAITLLDQAERRLDESEEAPDMAWPWVFPFNRAKIASYRAITAVRLGKPNLAHAAFAAGAASSQSPKQRAAALVDHARTFLVDRQIAEAATLALRALELGERFGSERVRRKITGLRRQIGQANCTEVRALDDRLNDAYSRGQHT